MVNLFDNPGNQSWFALKAFDSMCNTSSWIQETRASNHISGKLKLFNNLYDLDKSDKVVLLNSTSLQATKTGQILLQPNLILTDVFYIPNFNLNLISVHKLARTIS